ncbi:NAD(P)/FAD-dependent oxidoreductase [Niveispirillum cyanobacteriorum]|uniref:NAD/FAD-binding protein n=1 Tax=Niveispirillum cyanobacteriorum TaxID=1612173 RepID=A0A2K9N7Q8_9PROT|nr:FAD-dependent oxidoreductase [Niveispirillum cyanobacteriorum]AUN29160.1 NAD/FAD-binding protein [Niveispirillum cyanobacteriorum]GGE66903.1 NAD/FAD-binding protein [Niveispirillum cyanobacteriorum]
MKIAVIGAGISGLSAAWLLNRHGHEVTVFEQNNYLGGHSNTVDVTGKNGENIPVDTGFIVFNEATYPNLIALFDHLGVPSMPCTMSFAVSLDRGRLEYSGSNLAGMFAQKRNLLSPSYHLMLRDIVRFYREAPKLLRDPSAINQTLGEYLDAGRYGHRFIYDHLLPMGAAIWSSTISEMLAFPAHSFVRFFQNHGLLKIKNRPQWFTVKGGSRSYVRVLADTLAGRFHTDRAIIAMRRTPTGVWLRDTEGQETQYDQVVIGAHADQALAMLTDADEQEKRVLGAFRYQLNRAHLHRDPALMPKRPKAWSAWNYLANGTRDRNAKVAVTYWMNELQGIDEGNPLFVTLNPIQPPRPEYKIKEFIYDHPMFDAAAIRAQGEMARIQGVRRTWFCGAYLGYGFHEDGLSAGLAVAEALGAKRPWNTTDVSPAGRNARPLKPFKAAAE